MSTDIEPREIADSLSFIFSTDENICCLDLYDALEQVRGTMNH